MRKIIILVLLVFNSSIFTSDIYNSEFISWCLQTKETVYQPYYPIISLGINCQPAYQMRLHGLRYEAYPFDWIICPFTALITLIENKFEHFLEPKYLILVKNEKEKCILNTFYGIKFVHDFRLDESFMEDYEKVYEIYSRRIERFYQRMNESSRALMIRRKITKIEAQQLKEVLQKLFPKNDFLIIAIDNSAEIKTDWQINGIINWYMSITPAQTWKGDTSLWTELFSVLKLHISFEQPQDSLFKECSNNYLSDSE